MAQQPDSLAQDLRTHDDPRLYHEADVLMCLAADRIAALRAKVERSEVHRNDLADTIVNQRTEIAALRAKVERLQVERGQVVRGAFLNKQGGVTLCQDGKESTFGTFASHLYAGSPAVAQAACSSQSAKSDPQASLSLTGVAQAGGADELREALQCLLASGGVIAEASNADLQAAIADPDAEPIVKQQAAAVLKARAALAAQPARVALTPDRVGIYVWVSGTSCALVLVNKRPSAHAPAGQFNGHVIDSTRFYDGCAVKDWDRNGKWTMLHDFTPGITPGDWRAEA